MNCGGTHETIAVAFRGITLEFDVLVNHQYIIIRLCVGSLLQGGRLVSEHTRDTLAVIELHVL